MSQSNEPVVDRPPVTADAAPPQAAAAAETRQTRIGRFRVNTDALRAYTMHTSPSSTLPSAKATLTSVAFWTTWLLVMM